MALTVGKVSVRVMVSPVLFRPRVPVDAICTTAPPKAPVGVPPPKITMAQPPVTMVPVGNVCRTPAPSESVQPEISRSDGVVLTSSTNSSWVMLTVPSPLASPPVPATSAWISLMTNVCTFTLVAPGVL